MLIGYAQVSTEDQSLDLQLDALKRAGCEDVYRDVISGSKAGRPGLENALSHLREGDTLVATSTTCSVCAYSPALLAPA